METLQMYTRVTHFHVYERKLGDLEGRVCNLSPQLEALPGIIDVFAAWRDDGQAIAVETYVSEEASDSAAIDVQQIWAGLSDLLSAPIQVATYDTGTHLMLEH
jgi:hypothetical protein